MLPQLLFPQPAQHIILLMTWTDLNVFLKFSPILLMAVCWGSSFSTQLKFEELLGGLKSISFVASSLKLMGANHVPFRVFFSLMLAKRGTNFYFGL